jgi:hypothetical protein
VFARPKSSSGDWFATPDGDQFVARFCFDRLETSTAKIFLQFLRRRTNRNVVGPLRGKKLSVPLKNGPTRVGTKIHVVDVEFVARTQDAKSFLNISVAIPTLQMHEDNRAIDYVDRVVVDGPQIISREFDEFHVRKIPQPLGRKAEHVRRNVGADPTEAASGQMFPDSTDAAADLEDDVRGINADVVQEKFAPAGSTRLKNGFILGTADVHFRTGKRFRERSPNPFVI